MLAYAVYETSFNEGNGSWNSHTYLDETKFFLSESKARDEAARLNQQIRERISTYNAKQDQIYISRVENYKARLQEYLDGKTVVKPVAPWVPDRALVNAIWEVATIEIED